MAYQINGKTVCLIGLDAPKKARLPDEMLWRLYKSNVLGIWPGEDKPARKGGKA